MITLRQLYIFDAVVRAGSFRRCAEQLGISQVSVSEHVRALEHRLGVKLFDRQAGALPTITEKGQAAHERAVDILSSVADLVAEMSGGASDGKRQFNVAIHSFLARDLPPVLSAFTLANPHVSLALHNEVRPHEELLEMVARRELDVAYFFALGALPGTRFVREEPLAAFVSENHPLAGAEEADLHELAKMPSIQLTHRDPLRTLVEGAFAAAGVPELCVGIETDDFGMILGSAQRGLGYVCMFEATAREPSRFLGLNKVRLNRPLPALQVRCATRPSAAKDPLVVAFCDLVERRWQSLDN